MDAEILKLTFNALKTEVQELRSEVRELKRELNDSKKSINSTKKAEDCSSLSDELIDTKSVLELLGISYNTLQGIIRKGLITPLRISPKRIRFSKTDLDKYLQSLLG